MARLYLFAAGRTEQTFASNLLGPHLAEEWQKSLDVPLMGSLRSIFFSSGTREHDTLIAEGGFT